MKQYMSLANGCWVYAAFTSCQTLMAVRHRAASSVRSLCNCFRIRSVYSLFVRGFTAQYMAAKQATDASRTGTRLQSLQAGNERGQSVQAKPGQHLQRGSCNRPTANPPISATASRGIQQKRPLPRLPLVYYPPTRFSVARPSHWRWHSFASIRF